MYSSSSNNNNKKQIAHEACCALVFDEPLLMSSTGDAPPISINKDPSFYKYFIKNSRSPDGSVSPSRKETTDYHHLIVIDWFSRSIQISTGRGSAGCKRNKRILNNLAGTLFLPSVEDSFFRVSVQVSVHQHSQMKTLGLF